MQMQTRAEQRRILEAERARGWAGLVWFVAATPPGGETYAAAYPARAIPVIPIAPDPEVTKHWAHVLQELFRHAVAPEGAGWAFEVRITNAAGLERAGVIWYEWGSLDLVCPGCGAVGWESCCCVSNVRMVSAECAKGIV